MSWWRFKGSTVSVCKTLGYDTAACDAFWNKVDPQGCKTIYGSVLMSKVLPAIENNDFFKGKTKINGAPIPEGSTAAKTFLQQLSTVHQDNLQQALDSISTGAKPAPTACWRNSYFTGYPKPPSAPKPVPPPAPKWTLQKVGVAADLLSAHQKEVISSCIVKNWLKDDADTTWPIRQCIEG